MILCKLSTEKWLYSFILDKNERCPHLNKTGLCNIISCCGEELLCDICREHPRFYNDTPTGKEVGIGMACEEACRIILNSRDYDSFIAIEDDEKDIVHVPFDPIKERAYIYSILKNASLPYNDRIKKIYNEYRLSPFALDDAEWHQIINSLEYLDESHKELFLSYKSSSMAPQEVEEYLERALAYFVYRHCSEVIDYDELCSCLGFCLFCERLLCSLVNATNGDIFDLARIVSEELEYSTDNTERIKEEFWF